MPIAPKIADFNIVDINTTPADVETTPGMAGVAVIQQGSQQQLQTYYSLEDVSGDYGQNSYVYNAASNYFNDPNATTFQVISYPGSTSMAAPVTSVTSANKDDDKDKSNSHPNTEVMHPTTVTTGSNSDPAVAALTKYYDCGAEYFVFEVANDKDQQTAVDLSNLVEGQQQGMLFLDQPTSGMATTDDFKWYQPIISNRSTVLLSMPYSGDPANYQFASAVLSKYAGGNPSSNLELTNNIPNIQPQDYYNFTKQDFNVYKQSGAITYCYRNNIPMLSSGNSASGYQVSNLITRDYLNDHISSSISNAIITAHNDGNDIHFDQAGVNKIVAIINMVLDGAVKNGYIKNPKVNSVDVNKIPENVKEEGYLNGLSYEWAPNNNINHVQFHQTINVPLMNSGNNVSK